MIIGGFRVSLRGPQVLEGGQFLYRQGAWWGWEQSTCSFYPGFLTLCLLWAGYFTVLSLVYYMRLAMHPTEDRLS